MGREAMGVELKLVHHTGSSSGYAGASCLEALMIVAPQFLGGRACSSLIREEQYPGLREAGVTLYGLPDSREIHVIGRNRLAAQIRDLLRAGQVPGWRLHELPDQQTPIQALKALLSVRVANRLSTMPFATAEEVAAVPDRGLLELGRLGPTGLAEIRAALTDPSLQEFRFPLTTPLPDISVQPDEHRVDDLAARLRPQHQLRYQHFLHGLATAGLPDTAVDRILASIEAEPVPPADPLVTLLLETAGVTDLLAYYTATHQPATAAPPV